MHNNTSDAIIAIETELGVNPSGGYSTVAAALADALLKTPTVAQVITQGADVVPLAVKLGNNANVSNLFEARDTSNNILFYVDRSGAINAQGYSLAGSNLLANTALTGNPTAPTQAVGNNSTRIATTAFVVAGFVALPTSPATNDVLKYNGTTWTNGPIANVNVSSSAAIAYSKLALSASIVNADIASGAAIAYSKLNLASSIVNTDIASGAAIALSKLSGYPSDGTKFAAGDGTWKTVTNPVVPDKGRVTNITVPASGDSPNYVDVTVSFNRTFGALPSFVYSFSYESSGQNQDALDGYVQVLTTTGATIRIMRRNNSVTFALSLNWMAF